MTHIDKTGKRCPDPPADVRLVRCCVQATGRRMRLGLAPSGLKKSAQHLKTLTRVIAVAGSERGGKRLLRLIRFN
jgi:hypothetical protein